MAINPKTLNEGEKVLVDTRTHVKALLVPLLTMVLIGILTVFATRAFGDAGGGWVARVIWGVAAFALLVLVIIPFLNWLTSTYAITNRRLITRRGILTRRGHDIPLARISDVAFEHGLVDRMLGCGTLMISDASTNGTVNLRDIPQVEEAQRMLNQLLNELHHDDGS
ncbi:MAG: PH domain-containing protein [Nocardioides sp.]